MASPLRSQVCAAHGRLRWRLALLSLGLLVLASIFRDWISQNVASKPSLPSGGSHSMVISGDVEAKFIRSAAASLEAGLPKTSHIAARNSSRPKVTFPLGEPYITVISGDVEAQFGRKGPLIVSEPSERGSLERHGAFGILKRGSSDWHLDPAWLEEPMYLCENRGVNFGPGKCSNVSFRVSGQQMQMYFVDHAIETASLQDAAASCLVAQWPIEEAVAILPNFKQERWGSPCKPRGNKNIGVVSAKSCQITMVSTAICDAFHGMNNTYCILHNLDGSHCDILEVTERHRALTRLSGLSRMADAGANIGDAALLLPGSGIHVFAFEPGPLYRQGFLLNFKANAGLLRSGRYPLTLFAGGMSDSKGDLWYPESANSGVTLLTSQAQCHARYKKRCMQIPVERIDHVVPHNFGIGFLKIDVEGLEARVLSGTEGLFCSSSPPRVIEFEHVRIHGVPQCGIPSDYYGQDCETLLKRMLTRLYDYGYSCSFWTGKDSAIAKAVDEALAMVQKQNSASPANGVEQHTLETMALASDKAGIGTSSLERLLRNVPRKSDVLCIWRRKPRLGVCSGSHK